MQTDIKQAMILAAGEGTRLRPLTQDCPKPLLPINGVPLIDYTLSWLKGYGINEIVINLHHLGDRIKDYLRDGHQYGLQIHYSEESTLLGTAGGVKKAEKFFDGPFVVVYGDNLVDFDLSAMMRFHREKGALATVALMPVAKPWEVGIVAVDKNMKITAFVEKPQKGTEPGNLANAGIYVLEKEVLAHIPAGLASDFGYDVLPKLIQLGLPVYGYALKATDYMLDTGTLEKYQQAEQDARMGKIKLSNLYRAVFLDRDGTIAPDVHYCSRVEDFTLFPDAPAAIKLLKDHGFKVIVVTNQSGLARGLFSEETLTAIHSKLHAELRKIGTDVDAIYYCPHHPDDGCACRKPGTVLFQRAAQEHSIDLSRSYIVGDLELDIKAGRLLGCSTVLVTTGPNGHKDIAAAPDYVAGNLVQSSKWIVERA
jgi:mannose-1-phosphate guanylyltransferase/phosphomannomutase